MAALTDVERIAIALPQVEEGTSYGNRAWEVKGKTFVWERPLRVRDEDLLEDLITDSWRSMAPARLAKELGPD